MQREVNMLRTQIPLAPEKERTVQTAQGMTMDAAKIFLARPGTMGYEDWWLRLYVMLNRVRTVESMLLYGVPPCEIFEAGPPARLWPPCCRPWPFSRRLERQRKRSASLNWTR